VYQPVDKRVELGARLLLGHIHGSVAAVEKKTPMQRLVAREPIRKVTEKNYM